MIYIIINNVSQNLRGNLQNIVKEITNREVSKYL